MHSSLNGHLGHLSHLSNTGDLGQPLTIRYATQDSYMPSTCITEMDPEDSSKGYANPDSLVAHTQDTFITHVSSNIPWSSTLKEDIHKTDTLEGLHKQIHI